MATFHTAQLQNFTIAGSGVSVADTTITLTSFKTIDGTNLALSDFGAKGYATVEPGSSDREESISFTGVTQNSNGTATLTGVKNVGFLYPYTETTGFSKSHPGGVTFVITNTSGFYNNLPGKDNNEVLTGYWTVPDPVGMTDIANKQYVLSVVNGGSVSTNALIETGIAGETVAAGDPVYLKAADGRWWKAIGTTAATVNVIQLGIAQGSGTAGNQITGGVLRRGIDTNQSGGSAGAIGYVSNTSTIATSAGTVERALGNFLSTTNFDFNPDYYYIPTAQEKSFISAAKLNVGSSIYAADSVGTDAYAITVSPSPIALAAGMIFTFKAGTANTGAATLNVNSLGATAILKNLNVPLVDGDILANQIVAVEYDGTNFQMLSQPSTTAIASTTTSGALSTVPLTIPSGYKDLRIIVEIPSQSTTGTTMLTFNGAGSGYGYNYHRDVAALTAVSSSSSIMISNEAIAAVVQYIIIEVKGGTGAAAVGHTVYAQTIFQNGGDAAPTRYEVFGIYYPGGGGTEITSLNVFPSSGTLGAGTRITVYPI